MNIKETLVNLDKRSSYPVAGFERKKHLRQRSETVKYHFDAVGTVFYKSIIVSNEKCYIVFIHFYCNHERVNVILRTSQRGQLLGFFNRQELRTLI